MHGDIHVIVDDVEVSIVTASIECHAVSNVHEYNILLYV